MISLDSGQLSTGDVWTCRCGRRDHRDHILLSTRQGTSIMALDLLRTLCAKHPQRESVYLEDQCKDIHVARLVNSILANMKVSQCLNIWVAFFQIAQYKEKLCTLSRTKDVLCLKEQNHWRAVRKNVWRAHRLSQAQWNPKWKRLYTEHSEDQRLCKVLLHTHFFQQLYVYVSLFKSQRGAHAKARS